MPVRPMVAMNWAMFASEVIPSDEVFENPHVVAVRNKSITNMPLPYYMLNAELPGDTSYEFDEFGNCVETILCDGEEAILHAHDCVDYLYSRGMIRQDKMTPFELDNEGNLIRSHFVCGGSTSEGGCCSNNATKPGQPEYGKAWKPENNSGCGCNYKANTTTCVDPDDIESACGGPAGKTSIIYRNTR